MTSSHPTLTRSSCPCCGKHLASPFLCYSPHFSSENGAICEKDFPHVIGYTRRICLNNVQTGNDHQYTVVPLSCQTEDRMCQLDHPVSKNVTASLIKSIQFQYVKSAQPAQFVDLFRCSGSLLFQLVRKQFEPKKKDLKAI